MSFVPYFDIDDWEENKLKEEELIQFREGHLPVGASVTLMPLGSKDAGKDRLRTSLIQSQLLDYFFGNFISKANALDKDKGGWKSLRERQCYAFNNWEVANPKKSIERHIPTHFQTVGKQKQCAYLKENEVLCEKVRSLIPIIN
ncbi:unnamed protein product [Prunus armeniaca]